MQHNHIVRTKVSFEVKGHPQDPCPVAIEVCDNYMGIFYTRSQVNSKINCASICRGNYYGPLLHHRKLIIATGVKSCQI